MTAIDLTDLDAFVAERHWAQFAWLRANEPVYRHPTPDGAGFWVLSRYDDVAAAYLDNSGLSSAGGAMLGGSFRTTKDTSAGRMLVASDPPRHRMLRQVIHQAFAAGLVERIGQTVGRLVDAALDRAVRDGHCDFATDVAPELPAGALMTIMGISYERAHELIGLTRRMIGFRDPVWVEQTGDERLRLALLQADIFDFFEDILQQRRAADGDDLIGVLRAARVNGRPLGDEEILYNCLNVAVGGNETSSYTAAAGLLALLDHPDQHKMLLGDANLLDSAIAEMLRWSSTNAYVQRVATRELTIAGRTIGEGESVTLWNASANRDERQFPEPERFLVDRRPNRHLSYGSGIHRCIGAQLAHVELSVAFRRLLRGDLRFDRAGEVRRLRSNFIFGITRMPLAVSRHG